MSRFLRGLALGRGGRFHAVRPDRDDPRPTSHNHGIRTAICGVRVVAMPSWWTANVTGACRNCIREAGR